MRRWLAWAVVLALALSTAGCSARSEASGQTMTLEIGETKRIMVQSGNRGIRSEITDPADIEYIMENLEAMEFQDQGQVDADGWTYALEWFDEDGTSLQKIALMGDGRTIIFDNHFYESVDGEIDLAFLDDLLSHSAEREWGITLSVEDVQPTGLTLIISQSGSEQGEFLYGSPYGLEVCRDGQWERVPYATEETFAWEDIGYLLSTGESREERITWEHLYGSLEAGTYRLSKGFSRDGTSGKYIDQTASVEFTIP